MTDTIELEAPSGFSLSAAADFYAGFEPMGGAARRHESRLELAFLLDGTFEPVGAVLTQQAKRIRIEVEGTRAADVVRGQLSRMLGLDADGGAWAAVGQRDERFGALQRQFPGFFTAGFPSPWEAGVSGVLSHRSSVKQAAAVRKRLSAVHGTRVGALEVMPSPTKLLSLKFVLGVPEQKLAVLHGLARAALDGRLDARRLRAMEPERAVEDLQVLHGIGPWTATHMLVRGASTRDVVAKTEPRVLRAFSLAYERPERDFDEVSWAWRPFRTWACIVLVRNLVRLGRWAA